jgi:enoyl-CoA hydratase/carnithine racemase
MTDPDPSYKTIRYERHGDIGTLTLARPEKRNAQNPLMWEELAKLGAELLEDETLRCLLVRGEGPTFSAGIDVVEGMAGMIARLAERTDDEQARAAARAAVGSFNWIPDLGCASVAAVHGHALGAGLQLALACDFRVFAKGAMVGLVEMRFGVLPDMGATFRLPRIVGESRARELILLGDVIDADEALRIGLANRVVADEDLGGAAVELAGRLAAQPPIAVRGARRAIDTAWYRGPEESFSLVLEEQIHCLASDDFKEGREAMVEGRAPQWQGR